MAHSRVPPRRKTTIEIPIPSIRKYVPGSGPPPPQISLVPPRDSTAYIIDQFVLPTDAETTEHCRRLVHYHIGFTDLPAVKLLIPCTQVLDYVSPRELEDWEYSNAEKKEEQMARGLATKQRTGAAKKQAGQPSKVPVLEAGTSVLTPTDEVLLLAKQVAGPSLSTPQKRKLDHILDEEEDTGETSNVESDDAAILRQLHGDVGFDGAGIYDDLEEGTESVDQLALDYDASGADTPSRDASYVPPAHPAPPVTPTPTPLEKAVPSSTAASTTLLQGNMSTPGKLHPVGLQNRSDRPLTTHSRDGPAKHNGTPWSQLAKPQGKLRQLKESPSAASPWTTGWAGSRSREAASQMSTPGPGTGSTAASASSSSKQKARQPKARESSRETPQKRSNKKKQEAKPEVELPGDEWEVKELLDDRWFTEQGMKVHKYLVLWEGDWPEDQNPTWEPAENIQNQDLIARYRKKKQAGLLKPPNKLQKTLRKYWPRTQYSSVAEAFEGGIDEPPAPAGADTESDTGPPDETFLVTENPGDITTNGVIPAFHRFDNMLARYNQSFSQGRRGAERR